MPRSQQRNLASLVSALGVSEFGSSLSFVLVQILLVKNLGASAGEMSMFVALTYASSTVGSLLAGKANRTRHRVELMVAINLFRAVMMAAVAVGAYLHIFGLLWVLALLTASNIAGAVFQVAHRVLMAEIIPDEQLESANGKLEGATLVAGSAGLGLSGVVARFLSVFGGLILDALTFLVSAALITRIRGSRSTETAVEDDAEKRSFDRAGAWVLSDRYLRPMLIATTLSTLASGLQMSLFALFVLDTVNLNQTLFGLSFAVAALLGAVLAPHVGSLIRPLGSARFLLVSMVLEALAALALPFISSSFWGVLLFFVSVTLAELSVMGFNIVSFSFRQRYVPLRILGDVNSFERFILSVATPVAALSAGWLVGPLGGVQSVLLLVAVIMFVGVGTLAISPLGRMKNLPRDPSEH